jgi:sulfur transfer complex TusBCD TusB component (DsrH family)
MKVLHIIREKGDAYPLEVIAAQKAAGDEVKVLLMQDAVFSCNTVAESFCCKEDAEARGTGCGNHVDYNEIVNMVFDADSVVNW